MGYWEDPAVESLVMSLAGDALAYSCPVEPNPGIVACWPCPVSKGDVIARVSDADAPVPGASSVNMVMYFSRLNATVGSYSIDWELMRDYFSVLP